MKIKDLLHFSWLIMDIFWLLGIKLVGTFMVIPTIILTILVLKESKLISIETIFANWTVMNILWMFSDFYGINNFYSKIFLISGFIIFIFYLVKEYLYINGITKKEKY